MNEGKRSSSFSLGFCSMMKISALFFVSILLAFILAEVGLRAFYGSGNQKMFINGVPNDSYPGIVRQPVTQLFQPSLKIESIYKHNQSNIFQAEYNIDGFGGREVPIQKNLTNKHLMLFGCSYLFGVGLNDSQTIPFLLGNKLKSYRPYNLGVVAGGMHNMLAIMRFFPMKDYIKEEKGIGIYLMFPEMHIKRAVGKFNQIYFGIRNPSFGFGPSGLEFFGSFLERSPIFLGLVSLLKRNMMLAPLVFNAFSSGLSEEDYRMAIQMIKESQNLYNMKFPKGRFVVAIAGSDEAVENMLISNNIDFIIVDSVDEVGDRFPYDGHFTPVGSEKMAKSIIAQLGLEKITD